MTDDAHKDANAEAPLSAWQRYKKNLGNTRPWDVINPHVEHLSDEDAKKRMDICLSCPELINVTKQCKKCGCIMPLKTKLKPATCPIGKW
mgnify:CR=1 FL=1